MPNTLFWEQWSTVWSIDSTANPSSALNNPWVLNRGEFAHPSSEAESLRFLPDYFRTKRSLATGLLPGGAPIEYYGVSLLEFDGSRIGRFRAYYDSAAFAPSA
jgi:hypothetical protein